VGFSCLLSAYRQRFTGPFNNKLSNPIILLGNKTFWFNILCSFGVPEDAQLDSITPLVNAQKTTAILGGSARLLEQDGIGVSGSRMLLLSMSPERPLLAYILRRKLWLYSEVRWRLLLAWSCKWMLFLKPASLSKNISLQLLPKGTVCATDQALFLGKRTLILPAPAPS